MKREYSDPRISGMLRKSRVVAVYIGWRTIPYSPVSMTLWPSCTSMVLDRYSFSLITSAYKR